MDMSYTSSSPTSTLQSPTLRFSQASMGQPLNGSSIPPTTIPTILQHARVSSGHNNTSSKHQLHLAGEGVGGGVGDHVGAAGGGLAVVHHAGELRTLVKLQPRDLNLAACTSSQSDPMKRKNICFVLSYLCEYIYCLPRISSMTYLTI